MIKRLLVELNEAPCDCAGAQFALDLESSKNGFELQIVCTKCKTYLSTPLSKLRALIVIENHTEIKPSLSAKKISERPKLVLIQGGAEAKNSA